MIELLVAIAILTTGLLAYSHTLVESAEVERLNEETALATAAACGVAEALNGAPFEQAFAAFNTSVDDDGIVTGRIPGGTFDVAGLAARDNDPDGITGEVVFPTELNGGVLELREDLVDASMGMPRDLNLDGVIDAIDHSNDYRILPVIIRVDWESGARDREFEVRTILGAR